MKEPVKIYVVIEHDHGYGSPLVAAYYDYNKAVKYCVKHTDCFVDEVWVYEEDKPE